MDNMAVFCNHHCTSNLKFAFTAFGGPHRNFCFRSPILVRAIFQEFQIRGKKLFRAPLSTFSNGTERGLRHDAGAAVAIAAIAAIDARLAFRSV